MALDLQGADKARPFAEKAKATYVTVVDGENLLGQLYGFKAVPNGFLIDEEGVVRYKKLGGFDIRKGEFADIVDRWVDSPSLDESLQAAEAELSEDHSRAIDLFRDGLKLYRQGKLDARKVQASTPDQRKRQMRQPRRQSRYRQYDRRTRPARQTHLPWRSLRVN